VNAFHVLGGLFAAWAVVVGVLGITREDFPWSRPVASVVGAISVLLAAGAIGSGVIVAANEEEEEPGEGGQAAAKGVEEGEEEAAAGEPVRLRAGPGTELAFDKSDIQAKTGRVVVEMRNDGALPHDVSIEGGGVREKGKVVREGGTSTVTADLKPGGYTFFCSVPGHRQGGMEGELTVTD
jgi:plastocyanin